MAIVAGVRVASRAGGTAELDEQTIGEFAASLRGGLLRPGDAGYDEGRLLWNGMMDKRPALIARCSGAADVITAVNFARTHDLLLAVRGGGHGVAGRAACDDGLMLDLSLMRGVRVDPTARTARVQGGATLGDMDRETQVFGLAVPSGVVSSTGVAGLTLGGGTGWQMRKRGLSIDNLLSADVVTASGELKIASPSENADLFWGLRGGGGNFGVVTSFEFQAYPVGPTVMLGAPMYSAELGVRALKAWRDFMAAAPEEFGASFLFWSIPANPYFPAEHHGKPCVIPLVVYNGDVAEGERLIQPLRSLGTPLVDLSGPIPWTALQGMFDPFVPKQALQYYWKSVYLNSLGDDVVDFLVERAATIPSTNTYLVILPFGGATTRVGADDTAFGRRDIPYLLEFDSMWANPADAERNIDWTRRTWAETQQYSNGGLYLNFPGFAEEGEDLVRASVGSANFQRLAALKAKYDPTNLFRLNLNVSPQS
jgi:FAD binding domain-containing protein/berberine-like enzyme